MRIAFVFVLALVSTGCLDAITGNDAITAKDIIQDKDYTKWVIEIDYVQGQAPSSTVTSTLESRMSELVRKDIEIRLGNQLPSKDTWSRAALDKAHADHQDAKTGGSTVVTHVMYVDGTYTREEVLGIAVGHEYVVIFSENLKTSCAGALPPATSCNETNVQTAVLVHEFGHIIGLVNNGIKMVQDHEHPDADKKGHSDSQNSVMWPSADTTGILTISNPPTRFDSADRADVCAAGGKC